MLASAATGADLESDSRITDPLPTKFGTFHVETSDFTTGPQITIAVCRGLRWICAACQFDMTGLEHREALRHFFIEHGTESDADLASRDFSGMSISGPRIGDLTEFQGWLLNNKTD